MKDKRVFLALTVLLTASLACGLCGGGGSAGSEGVAPSTGGGEPGQDAPSDSGNYDTEFPLPPQVDNFMDLGNDTINYQTSMKLNDVVAFYRGEFEKAGYDERDITTVINDTTFSIVWDGHPSGKALVVQGVDLGDGNMNVNVRLEE